MNSPARCVIGTLSGVSPTRMHHDLAAWDPVGFTLLVIASCRSIKLHVTKCWSKTCCMSTKSKKSIVQTNDVLDLQDLKYIATCYSYNQSKCARWVSNDSLR